MNPGYWSYIFLCMTLVLFATGWRKELVGDIPERATAVFFVSWIVLVPMNASAAGIALGILPLVLAIAAAFRWTPNQGARHFHLIACAMLLAATYYLYREMLFLDPVMSMYMPPLDRTALIAILTVGLARGPLEQLTLISLGLFIGYLLFWNAHRSTIPLEAGSLRFYDEWWSALLFTRLLTLFGSFLLDRGRRTLDGFNIWRKNRRGGMAP